MFKQLSISLAIACLVIVAKGQENEFRVLATSGKGLSVTSTSGVSHQLSSGDILSLNDELTISENSYVGLVYKNGQTYELTRPGTYSLIYIYNQIQHDDNLATKYLNFLWDKVYNSLTEAKASGRDQGLNIQPTGVNSGKLQILSADPQKLNPVYGSKIDLRWIGGPSETTTYVVNVMNLYDEVLISEKVSQQSFQLNLSDERLQNDQIISNTKVISLIVFVENQQEIRSWRYGLSNLRGTTAESVNSEIQFFGDVLSQESALDRLIYATYFEEKGLLLDALTVYQDIIAESPEVDDFKLLRNAFIKRTLPGTSKRGL